MYRLIPAFISKKDVESYPFVGRIAKLTGSVFLDRDNILDRKNAVKLYYLINKISNF